MLNSSAIMSLSEFSNGTGSRSSTRLRVYPGFVVFDRALMTIVADVSLPGSYGGYDKLFAKCLTQTS
jgi:hypothetical protein